MSHKRTEIKDSKNTILGSEIKGGKNVHIGDVVHNHPSAGGDSDSPKKKSSFELWKIVLFSFTLIGVSITVKKFVFFEVGNSPEVEKPVATDSTGDENKEAEPIFLPKPPVTKAKKSKTTEKSAPLISNYIDLGQSAQTAMLPSSGVELPYFQGAIKSRFAGLSDTYFRPAFQQKFGNSLEKMDVSALREIGLAEKIKCSCQIIENIKYEPNEVAGVHMVTARGRVQIYILNLKTGKLDQVTFTDNGSGLSEATALESLEEHLLQSEKLNSINTRPCK